MPEMPMPQGEQAHKKGLDLGQLFGKKEAPIGPSVSDVLRQVTEMSRRIRILESRHTDLGRRVDLNEKNVLGERKRVTNELKTMDSEMLEIKRDINSLKTKVDMIISELGNFAAKEDIESIRKYIELWEPVNFITREEVEKIVKEAMEK